MRPGGNIVKHSLVTIPSQRLRPWANSNDNCAMPWTFPWGRRSLLAAAAILIPGAAAAQSVSTPQVTLPTVTVTAQKEPADAQKVPVSVTAVSQEWLRAADVT